MRRICLRTTCRAIDLSGVHRLFPQSRDRVCLCGAGSRPPGLAARYTFRLQKALAVTGVALRPR